MARSSAVVWFGLFWLFSVVVDLISVRRLTGLEKDLEIVLLRQQLGILQRTQHRPPGISRSEKLTLAVLTTKLKQISGRSTRQLGYILRLFKPETVLRWHRDLVARKWTFKRQNRGGR